MNVKRVIEAEKFEIGDVISFSMIDGEEVEAMAVKEKRNGMLFVFVDCLYKEYAMFKRGRKINERKISYMNSDLRNALNGEILERFPEKIRSLMVAVNADGDMLRIPTECEIFGNNFYGQEELETVKHWKPMKRKRNRISFRSKEGELEWYWLMNQHKENPSFFVFVGGSGLATYTQASSLAGVRPVFLLSQNLDHVVGRD